MVGCFGVVNGQSSADFAPVMVESGTKPELTLSVSFVDNETQNCHFQLFYGSGAGGPVIFSQTKFLYEPQQNNLVLSPQDILVIKCVKGSFLPVFIQLGGYGSGIVPEGWQGPFCIMMWLGQPMVHDSVKVRARYCVKKGTTPSVGIKIGKKGDYRFVADKNVQFLI
jgi:hypothetical protein